MPKFLYWAARIFCLCNLLLLASMPAFAQEPEIKLISEAANSGLQSYLNRIPAGAETEFGFADCRELARATPGQPIPMLTIVPGSLDGEYVSGSEYLMPIGDWRVPVVVDGQMRALLTVAKSKGVWRAVGIGAAGLAKELQALEHSHGVDAARQKLALLRVYQAHSDFLVVSDSTGSPLIYPLQSAVLRLSSTGQAIQTPYTEPELRAVLKQILTVQPPAEK